MEDGYIIYKNGTERKRIATIDQLPLITRENLYDYTLGNIPVGRFFVNRQVRGFERDAEALTSEILGATLGRAADPADPLFCPHAARKHEEYYTVLDSLTDERTYVNLYWQPYPLRKRVDNTENIQQLVMVGNANKNKISIPGPMHESLLLRHLEPEDIFQQLNVSNHHPAANYLTAIYCELPDYYFDPLGFSDPEQLQIMRELLVNQQTGMVSHNPSAYTVALEYLVQFGMLEQEKLSALSEFHFRKVALTSRPKVVFQPVISDTLIDQSTTAISTAYFEYS